MNREDIIRMAREAGLVNWEATAYANELERFAALVAKHTLSNIDPSSFMSWQEGYEAGKQTEREKYEAIITNMTKLLEAQQNREGVAVDMIAAGIAAEREACAKVCEDAPEPDGADLAERIRARGQA